MSKKAIPLHHLLKNRLRLCAKFSWLFHHLEQILCTVCALWVTLYLKPRWSPKENDAADDVLNLKFPWSFPHHPVGKSAPFDAYWTWFLVCQIRGHFTLDDCMADFVGAFLVFAKVIDHRFLQNWKKKQQQQKKTNKKSVKHLCQVLEEEVWALNNSQFVFRLILLLSSMVFTELY